MSLYAGLQKRAAEGRPIRVGLIGAGKFGAMYLAQVPKTPGIHLAGIADLSPANAIVNLKRVGWAAERCGASSLDQAVQHGTTHVGDDWQALIRHASIDIVVECTGNPIAAVEHCLEAFRQRKHVVNVTVEADAFCGPLLARKAAEAGVVYSLAFGDQPALICDLVDWARAAGFGVVAAGRGHKWLPHFAQSTPETVWGYYGLTPEQASTGGLNPKMFNSFLDGSKPSIESTAVCNATGLAAPPDGLAYPPASIDEIPSICRPRAEGGVLHQKGQVEVISSLQRDGTPIPYDIRFGVFVVFEGDTEYIRNCFKEYMVRTDESGRYACLYKRWHLIGLEVGISVASVGLRGEATGAARCFNADVVATAKRDLAAGELLDGEGGYTVWGKLLPASTSLALGGLPLGLAHNVKLVRAVRQGETLAWNDVAIDAGLPAYQTRREMEALFAPPLQPDGAPHRADPMRSEKSTADSITRRNEPAFGRP
jgi:predicted homoserine dehydrogenase-like protein